MRLMHSKTRSGQEGEYEKYLLIMRSLERQQKKIIYVFSKAEISFLSIEYNSLLSNE
jgi:hypothetical protein